MKLSKKLEAEVMQVYDTWLNSYLNGDVKTYDYYFDDEYHFIGSTNNEEFLNRKNTTAFFEKTANQLSGKTDLKNRVRKIELFEKLVFITELFDAYFLIGTEWTYYGRFRFTSALRNNKEGWRFIYQHFSMPDSKAQEGETLGAEQVSKENQELRDAIKRRTVELEQKNKELQIEAALERVRVSAMAMDKSEDLTKAVSIVFSELENLGLKTVRCGIGIFNDQTNKVNIWTASLDSGNRIANLSGDENLEGHPLLEGVFNSWKQQTDFSYKLEGDDLVRYYQLVSASNVPVEAPELNSDSATQFYHCVMFPAGGLFAFGDYEFSDPSKLLMKRFAEVFHISFIRHLDLKKAEEQAREAHIEAALERVRASSMAMHHSEELEKVVKTLSDKLIDLGISLDGAFIFFFEKEKKNFHLWIATNYLPAPIKIDMPYAEDIKKNPIIRDLWQAIETGGDLINKSYFGKEKDDYFRFVAKYNESKIPEAIRKFVLEGECWTVSFTAGKNSIVGIDGWSGKFITQEDFQVLKRFANVFEQAYTRFLDLQKAEAQAREAQIEASLERVRAKAMAMHQSDELSEVLSVLFEQFDVLGICPVYSQLSLLDLDTNTFIFRCTGKFGKRVIAEQTVAIDSLDIVKETAEKWKNSEPKSINELYFPKEVIPGLFELFKEIRLATPAEALPQAEDFPNGLYVTEGNCQFGYMGFAHARKATEEEKDIVLKFATEFGRLYQRFLDLQKAEAQAREAMIEAALERVRVSAMIMRTDDDLILVCEALYKELKQLGFKNIRNAQAGIINAANKTFKEYSYSDYGSSITGAITRYIDDPISLDLVTEIQISKDAFFKKQIVGEKFENWRRWRYESMKSNDPLLETATSTWFYIYSVGTAGIGISTFDAISEEQQQLLKRFRNVFELSYTRFLDLKQAEEQAREAKIEAALERVRSRTMGMQHSDELQNTALLLFEQVQALSLSSFAAGFNIWDDDRKAATAWMATENALQPCFKTSSTEDVFFHIHAAAQRGESLFVREQVGDELEIHYRYMSSIPTFKSIMEDWEQRGVPVPSFQIMHCAFFSQGYLLFISHEPVPEAYDIFKRFANVFEQTYTRFLDLQKAEAQAREAMIEAALERVRSRSMAMHKSSEVMDVAVTVYEQLQKLDFKFGAATIIIMDKNTGHMEHWLAGFIQKNHIESYQVNNIEHPLHAAQLKAWREGAKFISLELSGTALKSYAKEMFLETGYKNLPDEEKIILAEREHTVFNLAYMNHGALMWAPSAISNENAIILQRFAKVFEQTYTRFLDLQKAEAQAREAQIQLALERVRARTMAMQHSDELGEASALLFKQVSDLGIQTWTSGFNIWEKGDTSFIGYNPTPTGGIAGSYHIPSTEDPFFINIYEAKKREEDFFVFESAGESLVNTYHYMKTLPIIKDVLKGIEDSGFPMPTFQINHCAFFTHGFLLFITLEPYPNAHDIFKRFAKVFEQTYTRFLDLQKAEAQAREAQIQLALERVRARTMAMQHSNELSVTATLLFNQIVDLGIQAWSSGFNIWQENDTYFLGYNTGPDGKIGDPLPLPLTEDVFFKTIYDAKKSGEDFFVFESEGESLVQTYRYMDTLPFVGDFMQSIVASGFELPKYQVTHCGFFPQGHLMFITLEPHPEAWDIFKRFTKEFQQTYTRFLDLQKAEAQAREAKIELALERVRARTMAMQKSDELADAAQILYQEFGTLGINNFSCGYMFIDEVKKTQTGWVVLPDGALLRDFIVFPLTGDHVLDSRYKDWKEKKPFHIYEIQGEVNREHHRFLADHVHPFVVQDIFSKMPDRIVFHCANFSDGYLLILATEFFSLEEQQTIIRFAKVFEMTYTRFLDLQKAEAQAREAKIEVAVERVRAKALAMHRSEDLHSAVVTLKKELMGLQIPDITAATIYLAQDDGSIRVLDLSDTGGDDDDKPQLKIDKVFRLEDTDPDLWIRKMWERKENYFVLEADEDDFVRVVQWIRSVDPIGAEIAEKIIREKSIKKAWLPTVKLEKGILNIDLLAPPGSEIESILLKMGAGFDLAYKRFLDLQKAETQAREAKIEVALERVRSKAMAMHKSEDLNVAVGIVFEELDKLNLGMSRCGIGILNKERRSANTWLTSIGDQGTTVQISGEESMDLHPLLQGTFDAWLKQEEFSYVLQGDDMREYYQTSGIGNVKLPESQLILSESELKQQFYHLASFEAGGLFAFRETAFPEEARTVMKRFAGVFNLTYKRFLDLQKAEAQAREAQIELGLERVRARAMAMQKSDELKELIATVSAELGKLDLLLDRCYIMTYDSKTHGSTWWMANPETPEEGIGLFVKYHEHSPYIAHLNAWHDRIVKWQYILEGEVKKEWDDFLFLETELSQLPAFVIANMRAKERVYLFSSFNNFGCLSLASLEPLTDRQTDIMLRFAKVFDSTYTRFNDLQKAEAQAREAKIEAALERVRSRTLAMQSSNELAETAAEVFKQLIGLGIEPNRLYIGIIKDESGDMEMWATDEDGTQVGQKFMFNKNENASVKKLYDGWATKSKSVIVDMEGKELEDYFHYLNEVMHIPFKGGLTQKRRVQSVAYFSKGFIGMASPDGQGSETIQLLERFAAVFNLTFTRFNDLKIAEAHAEQAEQDLIAIKEAKQKAEEALIVLQATQKQLIQSEKMASLGELTAGIAHEIQNPLNFVNNFSEVSKELLDEMKEAIEKGHTEDAIEIMNDVIQNLEKINHHGKRADGIVKGMLQHSSSGSGQKEPTDINALADEYLRLSYHGLRAKDKNFNATMKTDFDESIGHINIIPQDIGRVILNLLTNAFYAVNEKQKQNILGYEPTVTIKTTCSTLLRRGAGGEVEIWVTDNGNGIPQKVVDKIFQPFFTTKPTGQGTGLGLSLSYDIIKAHGGEIKVITLEGEGTEFIIQLPIN